MVLLEKDTLARFEVHAIEEFNQFEKLESNWKEIYLADDKAKFYLSWLWLSGWFKIAPNKWLVLAVWDHHTSNYVGFLPLGIRPPQWAKFHAVSRVTMGSQPLSNYTGILCQEKMESLVLKKLANYFEDELSWDIFRLTGITDKRSELFVSYFSKDKFRIKTSDMFPSLFIHLPDSWDKYEANLLGQRTRKTLNKAIKKIEEEGKLKITNVSKKMIDRDIEIVLNFWQDRFGAISRVPMERKMLHHYFDHGRLLLNIYWDGSIPVSAQVGLLDDEKETFIAYITGYDSRYSKLSPGLAVQLISIREAIKKGTKVYDFLLGNDQYKRSLGASELRVKEVLITRKQIKTSLAIFINNIASIIKRHLKRILK